VPHVNIKYFDTPLSGDQVSTLVTAVADAVRAAFDCDDGVVSVALEPIEPARWDERVYRPEIVGRRDLLRKLPNY
jgi:4-oxalocrotonate tautomerase